VLRSGNIYHGRIRSVFYPLDSGFAYLAIVGPLGGLVFVLESVQKEHKRIVLAGICAVLFAYGWVAFMGQPLAACGGMPFLGKGFEWPILFTDGAVEDSLGMRYVPHTAAGRIQVYDRDGNFLHGWFVEASGGPFTLHVTEDDKLEVFTVRGNLHLVFSGDGTLLEEGYYADESYPDLPFGPSAEISLRVAWYLLPLASPLLAWLVGLVGFVGMIILNKYNKMEPNKDDAHGARTPRR
jgi:hypothetical protein